MKKLLSMLLALTLLFVTACGGNNTPADNSASSSGDTGSTVMTDTPKVFDSIYTDLTGIDANKTVMTVGDNEVSSAMYFYWTVNSAQNLIYQLQMYAMYYGMYAEAFQSDGSIDWNYQISEGVSLAQYVEQQTRSAVSFYAAVENLAADLGVTLTEEDRAAMEKQMNETAESYRAQLIEKDPSAESLTAEEIMAKYLETIGISEALFERLSSVFYLYEGLKALVMTPGSALYLEDSDCNEYGYYADHILISTVDSETREPLGEEAVLEKTALARDILTRLEDASDPIDLFNRLADEYSEDPGRQTNPTGYIFTPGTMVAEFENATEALGYGEISGIVESDYGYHIILRKDMAEGLALYPDQKAQFAEEHLNSVISLEIFDSETTVDEVLSGFDYGKFFTEYTALVSALGSAAEGETATE